MSKILPYMIAGAVILGAGTWASYAIATHIEHAEIDVVSKERLVQLSSGKNGSSSSSLKNFVYTADEAYVVEDSLWNGHFLAGTVYAKIHEGQRCRVILSGHRIGFLSMYQNIISADCGDGVRA
jgi:hypothetical protein